MISVSLIACTSDCLYQQDGCCCLERAASGGCPDCGESCVNFVPRSLPSQNHSKRLPDIFHANQL